MRRATILLVSDDLESGRIWEFALSQLELHVALCSTPQKAAEWRAENVADLIIIDEATRNFDGIFLVRQWRSEITAPMLLLTGGDIFRVLEAYAAGADECTMKPVSPALFLAKVKAWLRHSASVPLALMSAVERGPFHLDPATQEVRVNDRRVALTNLEFRLLHLLIVNTDQVLPSQFLIDQVWRYDPGTEGAVLKNAIYRLRRKIEADPSEPQHIHAVPGEGYIFRL